MAFGDQQPIYLQHGLITFPINTDKVPAVKNWQKIGRPYSEKLAKSDRHAGANVGLQIGKSSGITILDVDSTDEDLLRSSLKRHGNTPIISRTASGKYHAWYRHNGEPRKIRAFGELPVDLLGGGFAVVPDSECDGNRYEFIHGGLKDLERLPIMKGLDLAPPVLKGSRDTELFSALRAYAVAQAFDVNEGALMFYAQSWNERCDPPMTEAELQKPIRGVIKLIAEGRCWTNEQYSPRIAMKVVNDLSPDAWYLLTQLRGAHWDRPEFILANAYAFALKWTRPRFYAARDELLEAGQVQCVYAGGRGPKDPPRYAFRT